ncbi:MAG: HNH nuclease family protein [Candidatus Hydrogenedentes bacterium]|nr:HNH nuclease family protein [Candidatus Hydrogenedentota bacterium]
MPSRKKRVNPEKQAEVLAEARRDRASRQQGYRERALAVLPHLCGRCGRDFSGAALRELTVHHKDHNHDNNPPDGSNWELLCVYCHDDEHQRSASSGYHDNTTQEVHRDEDLGFKPFAGLGDIVVTPDRDEPDSG